MTFSEDSAGHEDAFNPFLTLGSAVRRLLRWGTVLGLHVGSSSRTTSTAADAQALVTTSLCSVMSSYSLGDLMWA